MQVAVDALDLRLKADAGGIQVARERGPLTVEFRDADRQKLARRVEVRRQVLPSPVDFADAPLKTCLCRGEFLRQRFAIRVHLMDPVVQRGSRPVQVAVDALDLRLKADARGRQVVRQRLAALVHFADQLLQAGPGGFQLQGQFAARLLHGFDPFAEGRTGGFEAGCQAGARRSQVLRQLQAGALGRAQANLERDAGLFQLPDGREELAPRPVDFGDPLLQERPRGSQFPGELRTGLGDPGHALLQRGVACFEVLNRSEELAAGVVHFADALLQHRPDGAQLALQAEARAVQPADALVALRSSRLQFGDRNKQFLATEVDLVRPLLHPQPRGSQVLFKGVRPLVVIFLERRDSHGQLRAGTVQFIERPREFPAHVLDPREALLEHRPVDVELPDAAHQEIQVRLELGELLLDCRPTEFLCAERLPRRSLERLLLDGKGILGRAGAEEQARKQAERTETQTEMHR